MAVVVARQERYWREKVKEDGEDGQEKPPGAAGKP